MHKLGYLLVLAAGFPLLHESQKAPSVVEDYVLMPAGTEPDVVDEALYDYHSIEAGRPLDDLD